MSKKGFLRGLIIKDAQEEKTVEVDQPIAKPLVQTVQVQGVADTKFIDLLENIIEQNNLPGQDYFEFKQAIENMSSMVMDEKTKFQTVFNVLSLQGCKKEVLLSSLDTYIQLIQGEKTSFDNELKMEYTNRVQSKLEEIEKAKKEIDTITKRLSELNNLIFSMSQEAQAEEMKIRAVEANFKASADVIINEMVNDKEKIKTYIL